MAPPAPAASDDRILLDNSNLAELKLTADESVERILSRPFPSSPSKWTVSHFHTDLRLVLGYAAALLMIAVGVWSYFIEKEWEVNKGPTAVAVVVYILLSAVQTADAYIQGNRIFYGSRKNPKTGKPEQLILTSPPLARHKLVQKAEGGRKGSAVPPEYVLEVEYSSGGAGAAGAGTKKGKAVLGHFAEWVTEEGEFVERIFAERLHSSLAKILGE